MHCCSRRFLSSLAFAGVAVSVHASVHAAELGEARVASHIGQQLVADIELAMIEDPAAPVGVRLADREVYNGAGIAMPAVLSSLNLSVMRRDGRQFLHVTSLRPVESQHLHLYLELSDKGQRAVRLVTLWLTPDPNPAPPPAPLPVPAPAPAPVAAPVQQSAPAPVVASAARPPAARPRPAVVPAAATAPKKPAPAPHVDSQPAACVRPPDEAQACVALGAKNAALREQLGKLEDKVKGLQASMGAVPVPANDAAPPAPPPKPAGPKPISSIKLLVPHKPKAPPAEEGGLPWGWIGAGLGLSAAAAGAALLLKRRGRSRNVDIPDEPGVFDRLRQRFTTRTRTPGGPAEPTLE
jgi:hypothetical protein